MRENTKNASVQCNVATEAKQNLHFSTVHMLLIMYEIDPRCLTTKQNIHNNKNIFVTLRHNQCPRDTPLDWVLNTESILCRSPTRYRKAI